jgi:hypothetical protein
MVSIGFLGPQTMSDTDIRARPRDAHPRRLVAALANLAGDFPVPACAERRRSQATEHAVGGTPPARTAGGGRTAGVPELDFWAERRFGS